jgi:hypothetical protein
MKLAVLTIVMLLAALFATAQMPRQQPKAVPGYLVVATCGTLVPAYVAGTYQAPTVDTTGRTCM